MNDALSMTGGMDDYDGAGVRAIIDTAKDTVATETLADDRFAVVKSAGAGTAMLIDLAKIAAENTLALERAGIGEGPTRKAGTTQLHTGESFAQYVNRHVGNATEVYADVFTNHVTAVINAGQATADTGTPGWGDYRAVYQAKQTVAWKAWLGLHQKGMVTQREFAEFIEDHLADIASPDSADMLELVQTFEASLGGEFQSSQRLSSGERTLVWKENVEARAGAGGQLVIPKELVIAVSPFEGGETVGVQVRFRFNISDGALKLGVRINNPEQVERDAFDGVVETISGALSPEVPVLFGAAPPARV